jgi:hypothetical protein
MDRVTVGSSDECWLWGGYVMVNGYGKLTHEEPRSALAHRLVYEHRVGPIPDGLDLDHLCRNRACVNPAHLEPVTRRENLARSPLMPNTNGNKTKTHCVHGHEYTPANTGLAYRGHRWCRECDNARQRAEYWRKKGVVGR